MVRDGHGCQAVAPDEHVAHVLGLLDGLARARRRALHEDLAGEGDEVLSSAAREENEAGKLEAGLEINSELFSSLFPTGHLEKGGLGLPFIEDIDGK
jgi:hypothetical protein